MMSSDFLKWLHDFLGLAQPKAPAASEYPAPVSEPVSAPVSVPAPRPVSALVSVREYAAGVWPVYQSEAYEAHLGQAVVSEVAGTPPERWLGLIAHPYVKNAWIQVRDLAGYARLPGA